MKSNSAVPGGSFASKPTWSNTFGCSATSAFFVLGGPRRLELIGNGLAIDEVALMRLLFSTMDSLEVSIPITDSVWTTQ